MTFDMISVAYSKYTSKDYVGSEALCAVVIGGSDASLHVYAAHILGLIFLDTGNIGGALNYLEKSAAAPPPRSEFYHNYGVALMRANDADKAIACFHQALVLNPISSDRKYPPAWRNLSNGMLLFDPGFVIDRAYAESARILPLQLK